MLYLLLSYNTDISFAYLTELINSWLK